MLMAVILFKTKKTHLLLLSSLCLHKMSLAIFSSSVSQPACFPLDATCIAVKERPGTDRIRLPNGGDKYEKPQRIANSVELWR